MTNKKPDRPSFESVYMDFAKAIANRSSCKRLNVGTVITSTDFRKVLAVGYNGNAAGLPNDCDRAEAGNCGCLHSEENAAINCDSPRYVEKFVFVTHLPCTACAKRLINIGNVKKVFFLEDYRKRDSLGMLATTGIETYKIENGEVIKVDEWLSNNVKVQPKLLAKKAKAKK
jgi:dCMP deaminase